MIKAWWLKWPNSNIGLVTGKVSGFFVLDVDPDKGGGKSLQELESRYGKLLETTTQTTGGGGKHFLFKHPGQDIDNKVALAPGLDIRGDGGMIVAAPSIHVSGKRYEWSPRLQSGDVALAEAPVWLLELIQSQGKSKLTTKDWGKDIPDGERDVELTRRIGKLIRDGHSPKAVLAMAEGLNTTFCKPPLGDKQVQKIVHSIGGRGAAKRKDAAQAAAARFTVLTQREMLRRYSEDETQWTVAGWLPEASCGLLVAPPGNYKTWILTALAYSVATGRPFLGQYPVAGRGPVLFVQQEDPWGMLQARLACMFEQREPTQSSGKNPTYELDCRFVREFDDIPIYWYTDRRLSFADTKALAGMEQKIVELRPRLIMIDPLYTAVDTKDYMAEGAQRMLALKLMRDKYGCSFVIAHHTTVSGSASADRSSIWGSQFLNAWLEFGWRLPEGDDKGNVVIRHFKSCEDPKRIHVKFNITDWSFGVEIDEKYSESVSERMEEMILGGKAMGSMRDIAKVAGCSVATASRTMKRMGVKKDSKGRYGIPDDETPMKRAPLERMKR